MNRIKELRKRAGLTQYELAERAGLDQSFISRLERGETTVSIENLCAIAEALGVTLNELMGNRRAVSRLLQLAADVPKEHQEAAADMLALLLETLKRQGRKDPE